MKGWVSQDLNLDVSSFGDTLDEAVKNLKEAVELFLEDENAGMEIYPCHGQPTTRN